MKPKAVNTTMKALGFGIAIVQTLDIVLHAATDQLELLRVTSNIVILLWLVTAMLGKANRVMAVSTIGAYLLLNITFLAREGVVNVEQAGGLRVTLFVLIFLTTALSITLTYKSTR